MILVIYFENFYTKTAVFDHRDLLGVYKFEKLEIQNIESLTQKRKIAGCIVSSVAESNEALYNHLQKTKNFILLNSNTSLPIANKYVTPNTLGYDRLANAVGAAALFAGRNVLIVDAGTCLKFDFINKRGEYLGGAISPGLQMRYRSLFHYTTQLPLLDPIESVKLIGDSTANSIHSGVVNGMIAEINGIVQQYETVSDSLQLILCGGDLRFFSNHLKNNIFAAPHLTLQGLNEILLYNQ